MKNYKDSIHSWSAAYAIQSNGYKILSRPKYRNVIAKTVVDMMENGLCRMYWLDKHDCEVASHTGVYDEKEYPIIGEKFPNH